MTKITSAPLNPIRAQQWLGINASTGLGLGSIPKLQAFPTTPHIIDRLFAGTRFRDFATSPERFGLVRVMPPTANASSSVHMVESHFFPHGWALNPQHPERAYFFEKQGSGAGVFNLRTMELTHRIEPVKQRIFYGHGVLAKQGALLLTTESDAYGTGTIGIRDTQTLAYLGDFPSYGARPHDCHLIDDGQVLVVSNGGDKVS